jgi:hypothetical protein
MVVITTAITIATTIAATMVVVTMHAKLLGRLEMCTKRVRTKRRRCTRTSRTLSRVQESPCTTVLAMRLQADQVTAITILAQDPSPRKPAVPLAELLNVLATWHATTTPNNNVEEAHGSEEEAAAAGIRWIMPVTEDKT